MRNVTRVLRKIFGSGSNTNRVQSFLIWAKTEYGKDWQYAYRHLLDHDGIPPKSGVHY